MNQSERRISQKMASEVFALAAELQAKHEQTYSLAELMEIGAEAHISPEFIKQALTQIQERKTQVQKQITIWKNLSYVGAAIILLSALTSLISLLNGRSSSIAKTQIQNAELLPIEREKLPKLLTPHPTKHHLNPRENRYDRDIFLKYYMSYPKPVPHRHKHPLHEVPPIFY
jgi:hypothetical protein